MIERFSDIAQIIRGALEFSKTSSSKTEHQKETWKPRIIQVHRNVGNARHGIRQGIPPVTNSKFQHATATCTQ